jgi:cellulose synthase (UDP-forming)
MADYAPPLVRGLLVGVTSLTAWVVSFIPRGVGRDPTLGQQETVG